MICFLCPDEINDANDSKEHIFLNCIGGRKTVTKFICKKCNSKTGSQWDNEVNEKLSSLALIFRIKRDRGKVQSQKITAFSGVDYYIHEDSISSDAVEYEIADGKLIIKGPSKVRIEQYKKKLIKEGIIPKDTISEGFTTEIESLSVRYRQCFNIPPCDSNFSKSLVKSSVALLASESFDIKTCNLATDYLVNNGKCCVYYAFDYAFQSGRPFGVPFHYVRVFNKGNMIYAYFEMYGFIKYMINLSDNYQGDNILFSYAIDPTKGKSIDLQCSGIIKSEFRHPAELQVAITKEFNFSKGIKRAFFSNFEIIKDDRCLYDYERFSKLFISPVQEYLIENIMDIERKEDAVKYVHDIMPYWIDVAFRNLRGRAK